MKGIVVLLLVLIAGPAFAQSDFYPGAPPSVQPFIPGAVPPGNPNFTSGTIASQYLDGVKRGSVVYFDVVLDWWGLTPLSLSPMSDKGTDFRYIDDPSDPWRRWLQPGLGYFCFRCSWQFTVTEDNPTLTLEYMGDWQFGAHLEVWSIIPPPPEPEVVRVNPILSQDDKRRAGDIASVGLIVSSAAITGAYVSCTAGRLALCGIFAMVNFASAWTSIYFEKMQRDPYDPEYQTGYSPEIDSWEQAIESDLCNDILRADDSESQHLYNLCWGLTFYGLNTHANLQAFAVSVDRMESCVINNDSCAYWQRDLAVSYLHSASYYAWHLGWYYKDVGVGAYLDSIDDGYWTGYGSYMNWFGDHLMAQYEAFVSVR